jgi:hypothetical protein
MPRRHPRSCQRRPGPPPPYRFSGRHLPGGFTSPGLRPFYHVFMPGLRGTEKREYFNGLSQWMVVSITVGCGAFGYSSFGVIGAVLGICAGLLGGCWLAVHQRFHRR